MVRILVEPGMNIVHHEGFVENGVLKVNVLYTYIYIYNFEMW